MFSVRKKNEHRCHLVHFSPALPLLRWCCRLQGVARSIQCFRNRTHAILAANEQTCLRRAAHILDLHNSAAGDDPGVAIRHDRNDKTVASVPHTPRRGNVRPGDEYAGGVSRAEHHGGAGADQLLV